MYLPSDTPLLTGQQEHAACAAARAKRRLDCTLRQTAVGRANLFETIINPQTVAEMMGIPAAVNVQNLQDASLESRAAILSGQDAGGQDLPAGGLATILANAPNIVPLTDPSGTRDCSTLSFQPRRIGPNPRPSMPQRGPGIVDTQWGPMYFRGAPPTADATGNVIVGSSGLGGFTPPWGDAFLVSETAAAGSQPQGLMSWISDHPWLVLAAVVGTGLVLGTGQKKIRRRRK